MNSTKRKPVASTNVTISPDLMERLRKQAVRHGKLIKSIVEPAIESRVIELENTEPV